MSSAHIGWLGMLVAAGADSWPREVVTAIYLWKWFDRMRVRPALASAS